ncbi:MAG TPA: O-antigen ligase family protein [Caulobacteraceae bacterium]|nr:O-antigen ligase family protein [Caulobacteraceae bacterium]
MPLASAAPTKTPDPVTLAPYRPHTEVGRGWVFAALACLSMAYGATFALLAPQMTLALGAPLVALAGLTIWALPDTKRPPTSMLTPLLFAFQVGLILWPNYLALALPGLPWITLLRLIGTPLGIGLLVCFSVSASFRSNVASTTRATPWLPRLLLIFVGIQVVTLVFSSDIGHSVDWFLVTLANWTAIFFVSVYVFREPGRAELWTRLLWACAIIVCAIGVIEHHESHVPWRDYIPSFLKINDETVSAILIGGVRSDAGVYRVQSTFSTSLGLGEFLALTTPFVVHHGVQARSWLVRLVAAASIVLFAFVLVTTDSRLGMIGFGLGCLSYLLYWAVRRWRARADSLLGPAIALAYPAFFCAAVATTFVVHRLRARIWGNGPQASSDEGREEQLGIGIPKILSHPWGHGAGTGAKTLGFTELNGFVTIDNYYLSIALEYGVLGFIAFYGLFAMGAYYSTKWAFQRPTPGETGLLAPLAISLVTFIVLKSVFSQQDNHPLVFMMLGMVAALVWRLRNDPGAEQAGGTRP